MGKRQLISLFIFLMLWMTGLIGQSKFPKTGACTDPKFDKVVDRYLSYTVPVIDVKNAFANQSNYLFLDARELAEFNVSHIPQARFVGYDKFTVTSVKDIPKDKPIIVYCSIGYRSEKIGTQLRKAGFKNVYNLYGSIFEWVNRGYPVKNKEEKTSTSIHTYNSSWGKHITNTKLTKVD